MDNLFCALGGGNHIGASCYYLQVDGHAFLLDCGIRSQGASPLPDLSLLTHRYLDGLWQLNQVILSHAHRDHVGALPYLDTGGSLSLLCNPVTKTLTELQLHHYDTLLQQFLSQRQRQSYEAKKERVLSQIQELGFGKTYMADDYRITQFPAGHIPGAAMTYIETKEHRILYTGDFSGQSELLCGACHLPENLPVDVLIIEGTHAYVRDSWQQAYESIEKTVVYQLQLGHTVTLQTTNFTKGIELARYLSSQLRKKYGEFQGIYLDPELTPIAEAFEKAGYQVYSRTIQPLLRPDDIQEGTIVIKKGHCGQTYGTVLNGDAFTLHADSQMLVEFINKVQAQTTILVHSQPRGNPCILAKMQLEKKNCIQAVDGEEYLFI